MDTNLPSVELIVFERTPDGIVLLWGEPEQDDVLPVMVMLPLAA